MCNCHVLGVHSAVSAYLCAMPCTLCCQHNQAAISVGSQSFHLFGPVPGSNMDEVVESMIKPEAVVDLTSAILAARMSAQSRTKKWDISHASACCTCGRSTHNCMLTSRRNTLWTCILWSCTVVLQGKALQLCATMHAAAWCVQQPVVYCAVSYLPALRVAALLG